MGDSKKSFSENPSSVMDTKAESILEGSSIDTAEHEPEVKDKGEGHEHTTAISSPPSAASMTRRASIAGMEATRANRSCMACHKVSDSLMRCSQCKTALFCDKRCLRKAGHTKRVCKTGTLCQFLPSLHFVFCFVLMLSMPVLFIHYILSSERW
jgi:hypothetical protein